MNNIQFATAIVTTLISLGVLVGVWWGLSRSKKEVLMTKKLNYGELVTLGDPNFFVADWEIYPDKLAGLAIQLDVLPILDAELELVCLVPVAKASLMVQLLNSYEYVRPGE